MAAPGLGSRRPPRGVPDGGRDRQGRRLGVGGVELMRERSMCGCDREAGDRRGPIDVWLRSGGGRSAGTDRCVAAIWAAAQGTRRGGRRPHQSMCGWNRGTTRPVPPQPADALVGPVGMRRCAAAERPANPARDRRNGCMAAFCRPRLPTAVAICSSAATGRWALQRAGASMRRPRRASPHRFGRRPSRSTASQNARLRRCRSATSASNACCSAASPAREAIARMRTRWSAACP